MNYLFLDLYDLLSLQLENFRQLLNLAERQSEILRINKAEALIDLAREQEVLALKVAENESRRLAMQVEILQVLKLSRETSLRELCLYAPGGLREKLGLLLQALRNLVKDMLAQNNLNRILAQKALAFHHILLRELFPDTGQTYQFAGKIKDNALVYSRSRTV